MSAAPTFDRPETVGITPSTADLRRTEGVLAVESAPVARNEACLRHGVRHRAEEIRLCRTFCSCVQFEAPDPENSVFSVPVWALA